MSLVQRIRARLDRAGRRILASDEQLDAEALARDSQASGCTPIVQCATGTPVRISGVLQAVSLRPKRAVAGLEAELFDGTGTVHVVWWGRRSIAGIEPGRRLTVEGRVILGDHNMPTIINPRYDLGAVVTR